MSDYSIKATITADDSGFQSKIQNTIKGLDAFGAAFETMTADVKSSFANLANQFNAIDAKAKVWGNTTDVVAQKQATLKAEINKLIDGGITPESKQIQDLKKAYDDLGNSGVKSGNSLSTSFAKMRDIMQGPIAAIQVAKQSLDAMWGSTIGQAGKMEDMIAAFTPLTGGAENAAKMVAALNKEAATTPFELEGIGSVAKQLLPVLGNDVNAVTSTFRMLGDTAGGNIQKLDSITRGYVKTMNSGKVSLEALNMISDAGVPIQTQLAESMGISVQQLYKMTSAGAVSSDELTKAFQKMTAEGGLFFDGMGVASKTLNGKLSTMSDNFKQAGAVIGNLFLPAVKKIVTAVSDITGRFVNWATQNNNLLNTVKLLTAGVAAGAVTFGVFTVAMNIGSIVTAVSSAMSGLAIAVKAVSAALAANPFVAIATILATVLVPVILTVVDKIGGWKIAFLELQKIGLLVVKALMDAVSGLANIYVTTLNGLITVFNKVVSVVGGKPIKLFDPIDIATGTGLNGKIAEIEASIRKEKEEQARLAIQSDKTANSQQTNAKKTAAVVQEESKTAADTQKKEIEGVSKAEDDARKKTLAEEDKKAAELKKLAEDRAKFESEWSSKTRVNAIENINAEKEEALKKAEDIGASEETLYNIEKYYRDETRKEYASQAQEIIGGFQSIAGAITKNMGEAAQLAVQSIGSIASSVTNLVKSGGTDIGSWAGLVATSISWVDGLIEESHKAEKESADKTVQAGKDAVARADEGTKAALERTKEYKRAYEEMLSNIAQEATKAKDILSSLLSTGKATNAEIISGDVVAYYKNIRDTAAQAKIDAQEALKARTAEIAQSKIDTSSAYEQAKKNREDADRALKDIRSRLDSAQKNEAAAAVAAVINPIFGAQAYAAAKAVSSSIQKEYDNQQSKLNGLQDLEKAALTNYTNAINSTVNIEALAVQKTTKDATKQAYIFNKVFSDGVTSATVSVKEEWASTLETVIDTYGSASKEVDAVNSKYTKLVYNAMYPIAAALEENNEKLKESKSLWSQAGFSLSKYTAQVQTQLSNLTKAASSFYDTFSNIGTDLANALVDNLSQGLDINKFMSSMKDYITKIVVQTAVYTDSMRAKIADLGAIIARVVSGDMTSGDVEGIRRQLADLYSEAQSKASAAIGLVSGAFSGYASGTDNATRGWHVVGEQGKELVYFGGGEKVVNARDTALAMSQSTSTSSNMTVNATFNSPKAMNQYEQMRALKRYNRELAFKGAIG